MEPGSRYKTVVHISGSEESTDAGLKCTETEFKLLKRLQTASNKASGKYAPCVDKITYRGKVYSG